MNSTKLSGEERVISNPANFYLESGYTDIDIHHSRFGSEIIDISKLEKTAPFIVKEDNGNLRSCYGVHQTETYLEWKHLLTDAEEVVREILQDDIYVHQSKINYKEHLATAVWPWHRDFPFWRNYDNIPQSKLINLIYFLDDVTEDSGPVQVIPGSHLIFFEEEKKYENKEFDELTGSVSSDLDFELPADKVTALANNRGVVSLIGNLGDMCLFHPDVIHQSAPGNETNKRRLLIMTYNACSNRPVKPSLRPAYFASPNYSPL